MGAGQGALAQSGVLAAMESADHAGAKALVEDLLAIAGIDAVGGRTRGRDRRPVPRAGGAALGRADRSGEAQGARGLSRDFRRSRRSRGQAARPWRDEARLDLDPALDAFERRNGFLAARGVAIEETRFSAAFVRDFDYYTGFVFEARDAGAARRAAGARRRALRRAGATLGAREDIPAVGAAIALDRLPDGRAGR